MKNQITIGRCAICKSKIFLNSGRGYFRYINSYGDEYNHTLCRMCSDTVMYVARKMSEMKKETKED